MTEDDLSAEARYCLLLLKESELSVFDCSLKALAENYKVPIGSLRAALDYMDENKRLNISVKGRVGRGKTYSYQLDFDGISFLPDVEFESLYLQMQKTVTLKKWNDLVEVKKLRLSQRMFLLILAVYAGPSGMVLELSYASIKKWMGPTFTKNRYRDQISKLKELKLIQFYRPGFADARVLGKVSSSYVIQSSLFCDEGHTSISIGFHSKETGSAICIGNFQMRLLSFDDSNSNEVQLSKELLSNNSERYFSETADRIVTKLLCFSALEVIDKQRFVHECIFELLPLKKVLPNSLGKQSGPDTEQWFADTQKVISELYQFEGNDLDDDPLAENVGCNILGWTFTRLIRLNNNKDGEKYIESRVLDSYLWVVKRVAVTAFRRALALRTLLDRIKAPSGNGVSYFLTPLECPIYKINLSFCYPNCRTGDLSHSDITLKDRDNQPETYYFFHETRGGIGEGMILDLDLGYWSRIMPEKKPLPFDFIKRFLAEKTAAFDP